MAAALVGLIVSETTSAARLAVPAGQHGGMALLLGALSATLSKQDVELPFAQQPLAPGEHEQVAVDGRLDTEALAIRRRRARVAARPRCAPPRR